MAYKITIDLSVWCTQAQYCRDNPQYKLGTISQWVKRAKAGKQAKIEYLDIKELGITLVKREGVKKKSKINLVV